MEGSGFIEIYIQNCASHNFFFPFDTQGDANLSVYRVRTVFHEGPFRWTAHLGTVIF
jgi:hypothetical protein